MKHMNPSKYPHATRVSSQYHNRKQKKGLLRKGDNQGVEEPSYNVLYQFQSCQLDANQCYILDGTGAQGV